MASAPGSRPSTPPVADTDFRHDGRDDEACDSATRGPTVTLPALIAGGSDRDFRQMIYALLTVAIRFDRLRERVGHMIGLSGLQYHILMVVDDQPSARPVGVGAVAEALHVSGAYITMETAKLVRMGLLAKRTNPRDRRGVVLSLTPKGRRTVRMAVPHLRRINDRMFARMTRADFESFRRIMRTMVAGTETGIAIAEQILGELGGNGTRPDE
jgi:DNA-binding MarR family transcriptional regulator